MINRGVIGFMLIIGIIMYFAIIASMISVKPNPDNVANQLIQSGMQEAHGQEENENITLGELQVVTEYKEDMAQIFGCELARQTGSLASYEITICKELMEKWEDKCKNTPTLINAMPCITSPTGYNVLKDFLGNKPINK